MDQKNDREPLAVDEREAARLLSVSPASLRAWRSQRKGPHFCRVGRRVVYKLSDLRSYLTANTEETERRA